MRGRGGNNANLHLKRRTALLLRKIDAAVASKTTAQLFSQVRSDLDHIYSAQFAGGHEDQRIEQTKERLSRLQDDMDHGRDDNNLLNDVVNEMENTAKDKRLAPRDRQVVADDVARLHEFQRSPAWHR